jgi:3-methyladenine DNA glycosylase AlkD
MKARSRSLSTRTKRFKKKATPPTRGEWSVRRVVGELRRLGTKRNVEGMARFGIRAAKVFGVSKPKLDELAKKIGKNHALGLELWSTGIQDAKILAGLICDPGKVTAAQMELWVRDFDNWDSCDGTCCHLFAFAKNAWPKALAWTTRKEEFQKRGGFALAAYLAYRDKSAGDAKFLGFLKVIEREADDERNFVRKAVNWALRNIGKRNLNLNHAAIATARRLRKKESRAARWIAADALRELGGEAVQARLRRKERKNDGRSKN